MTLIDIKNKIIGLVGIDGQKMLSSLLDNNYLDGFRDVKSTTLVTKADGGKDIVFTKNRISGVVFSYFPDSTKSYKDLEDKVKSDVKRYKYNNLQNLPFQFIIAIGTNQEISEFNKVKLIGLIKNSLDGIKYLQVEFYDLIYISQELNKPLNLFHKARLFGDSYNIISQEYNQHSISLAERYSTNNNELAESIKKVQEGMGLMAYPHPEYCKISDGKVAICFRLQGLGFYLDVFEIMIKVSYFKNNIEHWLIHDGYVIYQPCKISENSWNRYNLGLVDFDGIKKFHIDSKLKTNVGIFNITSEVKMIQGDSLYAEISREIIYKNGEVIRIINKEKNWLNPNYYGILRNSGRNSDLFARFSIPEDFANSFSTF